MDKGGTIRKRKKAAGVAESSEAEKCDESSRREVESGNTWPNVIWGTARKALIQAVGIWFLLCVALKMFEEKLIFVGIMQDSKVHRMPPGVTIQNLARDNGQILRVAVGEHEQAEGITIFFGGNAEAMQSLVYRAYEFSRYNQLVVCPEPPGYGESPGPVTMEKFYENAEQALDYAIVLSTKTGNEDKPLPITVVGSSLGTFSALHLAASSSLVGRVLLHAPLTTLPEIAQSIYWFVPVKYLMNPGFHFSSRDHVQAIAQRISRTGESPPQVLVIHGDKDSIVPQWSGREICSELNEKVQRNACKFVNATGHGHNDVSLGIRGTFSSKIKRFLNA